MKNDSHTSTIVLVSSFIIISIVLVYAIIKEKMSTDTTKNITSLGAINNPMNIVQLRDSNGNKIGDTFVGEIISPSYKMKSFATLALGYRAGIKILRTYYNQGYTTLDAMIRHYTATDKDENNYIRYVSDKTGIQSLQDIKPVLYANTITNLIGAMSEFEQGNNYQVNNEQLTQSYNLV